jgi:cytoplasmic tRNA 2-thiolation protein 2
VHCLVHIRFITMPEAMQTRKCADCGEKEGSHEIRKRFLCANCFMRYVGSKILKRMESYRIKNQTGSFKPRLLLPLSGGVSSLVLLSVLDAQLQKQISMQGRTAYDLIIAHIDTSFDFSTNLFEWYNQATSSFPLHTFVPPTHISSVVSLDQHLTTALSHLGMLTVDNTNHETNLSTYQTLLQACRTSTARTSTVSSLLSRHITAIAHEHACNSILYGHSDSRLAALSLAAVASGRGASVPSTIADGPSAAHGLSFNYPCRDLFKTELQLYASLLDTPLVMAEHELVEKKAPPSIKSQSIDELLTGYITSQGERYPSIMANVVRTAGKLERTEPGTEDEEQRYCVFCRGLMLARDGDRDDELCYGCRRMKQDIKIG